MVRVVFHLHCYQPPREDPWTGAVPVEPSAAPAHDWNQRVTDECYRPLRAARLLDARGMVVDAVNLYRDISVDIGATLHRWVAQHARDVDAAIRDADRDALALHGGHGAAVAQPYVHAILPLANARDKVTLVRWGISDFRNRFGRDPEGIWLPEAAVDLDTLEVLAAEGVAYTILGQHQAARVRDDHGEWVHATGVIDPTRPHVAQLPSGRSITICFYDGALSHAIAFDRTLLDDGARLAEAVAARVRATEGPACIVLATDGETFGHHHRFGEMALARALHDLAEEPGVTVGGLGAALAEAGDALPEVEVASPSAWSCAHGVERWRADCGDVTGGEPHWNQRWRAPLREAIDVLVDRAGAAFEAAAVELVADPWAVRDAYGEVVDAGLDEREAFVRARLRTPAQDDDAESAAVLRMLGLLEMQRHLLFAQSSCAWFFADCAGIETAITLHHAARSVELVGDLCGVDLDSAIAGALAPMQSNDPDAGDGMALWRAARAAAIGPDAVAAAWAATALVGTPLHRLGALRIQAEDVVFADEPSALTAVVSVVDEATGATAAVPIRARLLGTDLVVDAGRSFTLADLPRDARVTVLTVWWHGLADREAPPTAAELRALVAATTAAGEVPDPDRAETALLRAAPAIVHRAAEDPASGMDDLAFLVAATHGSLPARVRWTAQNAVLAARDHVLPTMQSRPDPEALAWCTAFLDTAAALGVTPDVRI